jgi:hypothetical protein
MVGGAGALARRRWEIGEGVVGVGAFEVGYACFDFLFGIMGCRFAGVCGTECGFVFGG